MSIYLDHAATTPLREEVIVAMADVQRLPLGNASSRHQAGVRARRILEDARGRVADALGVQAGEIVFVRGGTEGDNLAVLGRAALAATRPLVVTTTIEHPAVLQAGRAVQAAGGRLELLRVEPDGTVDLDGLEALFKDGPQVVSAMWVNNETGLQLPILEVARRCRAHSVACHTDAVQAVGKVPVDLSATPVDLLSASAHKFGGPGGTGILFVRNGTALAPILHGGGHERMLRPGTSDVVSAAGTAVALELAISEQPDASKRWSALASTLLSGLREALPGTVLHCEKAPRAPHIVNVRVPVEDSDGMLAGLDLEGIAVSGGSACASGSTGNSHVLAALYGEGAASGTALRFSFGVDTNRADVLAAVAGVRDVAARIA